METNNFNEESQEDYKGLLAYLKDCFDGADVITTTEFAKYMKISPSTLCQMRKAGTAPRIVRLVGEGTGRIFLCDMARWIEERGVERKAGADGRGRQVKKSSGPEETPAQLAIA